MSFFLFSRAQKKETNSNKKFFNVNNKIIKKEFNDTLIKNKTFNMNKIKNKNIHIFDKNYSKYKNTNNLDLQKNVKKVKINLFNINKKDSMETISDKVFLSVKKENENSNYLLFKESLYNYEKNILSDNYSKDDKNLINGLFNKFFILNNKKFINTNLLKDKNFVISKLCRYTNSNKHKFSSIIIEKNNLKKKTYLFKSKDINKDTINSKKI